MAGFGLLKRLVAGGERRHSEPRVRAATSTRVLVVDDSATIRAVLGKMLGQDGYEVLKAADGESALELARDERPDLVFLDIVLPGLSGFAVLRKLRHDPLTAHIPIVMISGNVQATEQFYVQRYGADDFMKKPFGRAEVFERIQQLVLAGRLTARAPAEPGRLPAGVSQAEWDAIPDIAMPDEAHAVPSLPPEPDEPPPSASA
ncbi:MAG TPA: response regulator [Rhodanobacter sp.]